MPKLACSIVAGARRVWPHARAAKNQRDADFADEAESADRSSLGDRPKSNEPGRCFDNSAPMEVACPVGRLPAPRGRSPKNSSGLVGSGHAPLPHSSSTIFQHAVRPGDNTQIVGLRAQDIPANFYRWVGRITVRGCYSSVFDDHWTVTDTLGKSSRWQYVRDCPAQAANTDL